MPCSCTHAHKSNMLNVSFKKIGITHLHSSIVDSVSLSKVLLFSVQCKSSSATYMQRVSYKKIVFGLQVQCTESYVYHHRDGNLTSLFFRASRLWLACKGTLSWPAFMWTASVTVAGYVPLGSHICYS